jgi:hypothetical protein
MMVVSRALKTVIVAKPRGLEEDESTIFPFRIPCVRDTCAKKQLNKKSNKYFLMAW